MSYPTDEFNINFLFFALYKSPKFYYATVQTATDIVQKINFNTESLSFLQIAGVQNSSEKSSKDYLVATHVKKDLMNLCEWQHF